MVNILFCAGIYLHALGFPVCLSHAKVVWGGGELHAQCCACGMGTFSRTQCSVTALGAPQLLSRKGMMLPEGCMSSALLWGEMGNKEPSYSLDVCS